MPASLPARETRLHPYLPRSAGGVRQVFAPGGRLDAEFSLDADVSLSPHPSFPDWQRTRAT
jgi:hypothetical protein